MLESTTKTTTTKSASSPRMDPTQAFRATAENGSAQAKEAFEKMSAARAERLKAELAALPKKPPEPFKFDWKQVQASLGADWDNVLTPDFSLLARAIYTGAEYVDQANKLTILSLIHI